MNPLLILAPLFNIGRDWLAHKAKMAEVKRESEVKIAETKTNATITRIETGDKHSAQLDEISISTRGWKDDYLLLLVTIPLIMAFVPELLPYAKSGFVALDDLPEWYRWVLLGVYIDTFGFRRMLRTAIENWIARRIK
jgi:hypothetical protein